MWVRQWFSFAALGMLVACGSKGQKGAESPDTPGAPGAPAAAQGGQQYAMADSPSAGVAANRPKMNAAAMQAHQAGLRAFQAGDLKGARAQFLKATQADAKAYQAYYSLGVVEERLGKHSAALSAYRKALGIVKDFEPAIVAYGVLLAQTGQAGQAEEYLNAQRAKLPESAPVLAALAEVKSIQKDSGAAQELAQEALKKNPDYRPAMVTLARDHYRNRRLDLALYTLKAILDGYGPENPARDKRNPSALLLRGLIYKEQGHRREAIEQFRKALSVRPDLVEARINLAKYMLEAGNGAEAVPVLETALRYDANNLLVHLNLGDAYRLQGRPDQAKKHLEYVISQDSSLAQAHYNLGLLYLFTPNIPGLKPVAAMDKALAHLERYKEMRPRSRPGEGDDVDELIKRAKNKREILKATASQPAPPAAAPPPPSSPQGAAPPAGGASGSGGSTGSLPPAQ